MSVIPAPRPSCQARSALLRGYPGANANSAAGTFAIRNVTPQCGHGSVRTSAAPPRFAAQAPALRSVAPSWWSSNVRRPGWRGIPVPLATVSCAASTGALCAQFLATRSARSATFQRTARRRACGRSGGCAFSSVPHCGAVPPAVFAHLSLICGQCAAGAAMRSSFSRPGSPRWRSPLRSR